MKPILKKLLQALVGVCEIKGGMLSSLTSVVSIRRCFYLSAIVLILSTLMATVIIVKLSPLETIKCQPHVITPVVDWSTVSSPPISDSLVIAQTISKMQKKLNDRRHNEVHQKSAKKEAAKARRRNRISPPMMLNRTAQVEPNYNIHIFYYAWYRSQTFDGTWKHWNHEYLPNWKKNDRKVYPEGVHQPPADIGANFYPVLGCYSSKDPKVLDLHMRQLRDIGVGVVIVSWSPLTPDDDTDAMMPDLLDTAHRYQLKVSPHIISYEGRNPINLLEHIRYLFNQYGSHPALYRMKKTDDTVLPVIYIYDSYVFPSNAWYELLSEGGNLTLRGTEMDAIYIGLLVEPQHKNHIKKSHFDGFYTYFAINNFSYGSTWKNWRDLNKFAEQNGLLFIPSVGPGYIDTRIRPWNNENSKHRRHGQYYELAWRNAFNSGASMVSITSFNQWHEGTQIEPAKPASNEDFTYLDYEPEGPNYFLNLTKWWVKQFNEKLEKEISID